GLLDRTLQRIRCLRLRDVHRLSPWSDDTPLPEAAPERLPLREFRELAEGEGFEPSSDRNGPKRFSRPPHSTTLPPLRDGEGRKASGARSRRRRLRARRFSSCEAGLGAAAASRAAASARGRAAGGGPAAARGR